MAHGRTKAPHLSITTYSGHSPSSDNLGLSSPASGEVAHRLAPIASLSRTLKVRGGIIAQTNRYLGGFCASQRIFPPQICQVLLLLPPIVGLTRWQAHIPHPLA